MAPLMTFLCLILVVCTGPVHAFYVGHIREPFSLSSEPGVAYERHYIWPARGDYEFAPDGYLYLNALADQIHADAKARGYLTGPSLYAYVKELQQYRSGHWPILFITKAGSLWAERHLCFANRLEDSPLPWEDRHLGDDDGHLPRRIDSVEQAVMGVPFVFEPHPLLPEASDPANQELLRRIGFHRPIIAGERTELKFLMGESSALLRELLYGVRKFQPHRWSGRSTTEEGWQKAAQGIDRLGLRAIAMPLIARLQRSRSVEQVADAIFSPELQPWILNSDIYFHVSGYPVGTSQETGLSRVFQSRMQIGDPVFSFFESASTGTSGIRTDIYRLSLGYFDGLVLRSLDGLPALRDVHAIYDCPALITRNLQ